MNTTPFLLFYGQVVVMALTGVIVIGGISIILNDLVGNPALTDLSETYFSVLSRRLRKVSFHKLKIPLVVFQVLYSVYCTSYSVVYSV